MSFCVNCGRELKAGTNFCANCGYTTVPLTSLENENRNRTRERTIQNCPSCGGVINSFLVACPYCGCEFNNVQSSVLIKEFEAQLKAIDAKESIGRANKNKINIIERIVVPNTKKDIIEFMILASSNIDPSLIGSIAAKNGYLFDLNNSISLSKAWNAKMEQVYQKAKISFGNDPDFSIIERIYNEKNQAIKSNRKSELQKNIIILGTPILLFVLMMCYPKFKSDRQVSKLNHIVEEIQIDIRNEDYDEALFKTQSLYYNAGWDSDLEDEWNQKREAWIEIINEKKEGY